MNKNVWPWLISAGMLFGCGIPHYFSPEQGEPSPAAVQPTRERLSPEFQAEFMEMFFHYKATVVMGVYDPADGFIEFSFSPDFENGTMRGGLPKFQFVKHVTPRQVPLPPTYSSYISIRIPDNQNVLDDLVIPLRVPPLPPVERKDIDVDSTRKMIETIFSTVNDPLADFSA